MRFKSLEGKPKEDNILASGGLELVQMVLEPDIGWCVSEDIGPRRRVDREIPHRLKRGTSASEDSWCHSHTFLSIELLYDYK